MFRKILCIIVIAPVAAFAGQPGAAPKHLEDARKLVQTLKPDNTTYRHDNPVVKWKGDKGVDASECYADCSAFLDALIQHSYPRYDAEALNKWFGSKKHPLAKHYYDTIAAQRGFKRIDKIGDVRPGDIIAIKYIIPKKDKSTGHTMLVNGAGKVHAPSAKIIDNTVQWEVPIIDSTMSGHGTADSRLLGDGTYRTGLGTGLLRIYAARDGMIVGYSWSLGAKSKYYDANDAPIVVGRLDVKFEP